MLLHGCEGGRYWSLLCGEMILHKIDDNSVKFKVLSNGNEIIGFTYDGRYVNGGEILVYPSQTLFEKYPLMPLKAWEEWGNSRQKIQVIENLANQYAKAKCSKCVYNNESESMTDYSRKYQEFRTVYDWLTATHFIVEKSEIIAWFNQLIFSLPNESMVIAVRRGVNAIFKEEVIGELPKKYNKHEM